ncbi:MAG: aminobutyraldehyde dehydrogenase [Elusimicrobia bacterium]|nr:aminobutyraldehyde dehydrogenase [Elusimicrobiota bacterium]
MRATTLDRKSAGPQRAKRQIFNPATGKPITEIPDWTAGEVEKTIQKARRAFEDKCWSGKNPAERSAILFKLANLMEQNQEKLISLEVQNTGKPRKLVQEGDIPFAIDNLRFFAGALRVLEGAAGQEYVSGTVSFLRREPIGVVGSVAPWNYPILMAVWKMAPALAAGNCVVLKPAEWTPLTALELERLAREAGIPEGVFQVVTGAEATGAVLTSHPQVDMVSFTGDTETGKKIMLQAAPTLKKCHLELGGKAPFLVFEDADLEAAARGAAVASTLNAGQDCTAATRLYVAQPIFKKFLDRLTQLLESVRVGLPTDPQTNMGPLISSEQRARVERFVERALKQGAKALCGAKRPKNGALQNGFFYLPTLLTGATQKSEIVQNEVFGPVACVLSFQKEEEAVSLGNDVRYGLAASVWTQNVPRALRVSSALRFGTVWINDHLPLASEMPHGGFKQSGFGKDLSKHALEEYTQIKHVMADTTGQARKPWHTLALSR